MRYRIPDPTPDLKRLIAAAIVADLAGCRVHVAGARLRADCSTASKLRNADLRRFSLQGLVRLAARLGIDTGVTLHRVELPRLVGGRLAPAVIADRARPAALDVAVRVVVLLDEALLRQAHARTGIVDPAELISRALACVPAASPARAP